MKQTIILFIITFLFTGVDAQSSDTVKLKKLPAQVSIWYPIGTSGKYSKNTIYNLSLNMGYGRTGGIRGVELSGLAGLSQGNVDGVQISGLVGFGNNVTGIQVSGITSMANDLNGIQLNGLVGMANNLKGLQLNGLIGMSNDLNGIQLNGLIGMANDFKGIQLNGLAGIADDIKVAQINGLIGVANNTRGIQTSGLISVSNNLKDIQITGGLGIVNMLEGAQISGLLSLASNVVGTQISGLLNVAGDVKGSQISGGLNRAYNLRGIQLGIVNITDTVTSGIPIGIVNIVRKDRYAQWEIFTSDIVNVGASYKMGIRKFYSIYSLGYNFFEDKLFVAGFGFGSNMPIGRTGKYEFQPELLNYTYFPNNFKQIRYTNATQLKLGFVRNWGRMGLYLAPSVYVSTMNKKDDIYGYKISPIGAVFNNENTSNKVIIGIGYTIGLTFRDWYK